MKINILAAKDIQHYMNELQKNKENPNIVRSDKYDEEKLTNFVPVYQIVRWIDNLRTSNDMWRYAVDECFGMLEDAITSDSEPDDSTHNKDLTENRNEVGTMIEKKTTEEIIDIFESIGILHLNRVWVSEESLKLWVLKEYKEYKKVYPDEVDSLHIFFLSLFKLLNIKHDESAR